MLFKKESKGQMRLARAKIAGRLNNFILYTSVNADFLITSKLKTLAFFPPVPGV
jgi:hypothetical protein